MNTITIPDNNNKIIALILARGGSKRIPDKNKKLLNGKPLISYTFEAVTKSKCFEQIVVSTDDKDISKIAKDYGIQIDIRPNNLCGDKVRAVEVIDEYLQRTNAKAEFMHVAMLLPTCPFRTREDIYYAVEKYLKHLDKPRSLISVTPYDFPPQLALENKGDDIMYMSEPDSYKTTTRSQSIEQRYHPNGAIYISSIEQYIKTGTFFQQFMYAYIMPIERSFDIDYSYQFKIADMMMKLVAEN